MQTQSKQYPQNLQWTELTPQIVSEWNLHDYMDLYLSRVDVERVVKMQVMTFSSAKREYNIRFFDVHENKEDAWVDLEIFTDMMAEKLQSEFGHETRLYESKRMLGSQKNELIESFAILGVLFMMFLLYLYSNLQH